MGEIIDGVDMRAEVGILTRNVVIRGEMEDSCYAENKCQFFDYDTFGGHVMVGRRIWWVLRNLRCYIYFLKTFKFWTEVYKDIKKKYFIFLPNGKVEILDD